MYSEDFLSLHECLKCLTPKKVNMENLIEAGFLFAVFSLAAGLKLLSNPKQAYLGNKLAATGVGISLLATVFGFLEEDIAAIHLLVVAVPVSLGAVFGKILSSRIQMTKIPQLVSLFNAFGGGCALIIAVMEAHHLKTAAIPFWNVIFLFLGLISGAVALSGSIVATLKLSNKISFSGSQLFSYMNILLPATVLLVAGIYFTEGIQLEIQIIVYTLAITSVIYGVTLVSPIGGADMPVIISFLNSITGIATASSGFIYGNSAMIAGGIFVGAAGLLLTHLMCKSMNKTFFSVIKGKRISKTESEEKTQIIQEVISSEAALQLFLSKRVAIIPGYGLAVAQAQHFCKQIQDLLHIRNVEVDYIIHPVAGRMPGHMNVLLAEADIHYEYIKEMDEVNDKMHNYDLALIIGANDVVNPVAENDPDSPVYGMPIIRAHKCKNVIVLKRSMGTGYAGIKNDLFELRNCKILFGDAKDSMGHVTRQLKELTI